MDVNKFIKTIQEHLDEGATTVVSREDRENVFTQRKDVNQIQEAYVNLTSKQTSLANLAPRTNKSSQMLPEIRGQIKNVKQLLQRDLEVDGVRQVNIPYSHRRRHTVDSTKESVSYNLMFASPSNQSITQLHLDPSMGSINTAFS